MTHDTAKLIPKRRGRKLGSGKGSTVTRVDVLIRNDQLAFWGELPNKSAFVQKAIDEAQMKQDKIIF